MAGPTLTTQLLDRGAESETDAASASVTITVTQPHQTTAERAWLGFNAGMHASLARAGFRQLGEIGAGRNEPPIDPWRAVAPGVMVRATEYEERFAGLDLAKLRHRLSPALFRAYVRHVGILDGGSWVDVNELVEEQSE